MMELYRKKNRVSRGRGTQNRHGKGAMICKDRVEIQESREYIGRNVGQRYPRVVKA